MSKKNKKGIYLKISTIKFPITAIASILHRISGFLLFIIIGPVLWLLKLSLSSEEEFCKINHFLIKNGYIFKFLIWVILSIFSYHIIFGIRQIFMDFGYLKQTLSMGKMSAHVVFTLVILLSICIGIYVWKI